MEHRTYTLSEAQIDAIVERAVHAAMAETSQHIDKLDARLKSLEDMMKSGRGVLIGVAATIGFLLADGITRVKAFMGINA